MAITGCKCRMFSRRSRDTNPMIWYFVYFIILEVFAIWQQCTWVLSGNTYSTATTVATATVAATAAIVAAVNDRVSNNIASTKICEKEIIILTLCKTCNCIWALCKLNYCTGTRCESRWSIFAL